MELPLFDIQLQGSLQLLGIHLNFCYLVAANEALEYFGDLRRARMTTAEKAMEADPFGNNVEKPRTGLVDYEDDEDDD